MFSIASFKIAYSQASATSKHPINFSRIKATQKWVEHSINLHVMQKLLATSSRDERYILLACIKAAENKTNYYYKHPNFDVTQAVTLFAQAKRMLRKM
jgi:hypothetical protein